MMKKVAIIGYGLVEVGKHSDKTNSELSAEVIKLALNSAKISKDDIDGIFTTPEGFSVRNAKIRPQRLCEYLGMKTKSAALVECGGVSSHLALKFAAQEIVLGRNKINLVLASEIERYKQKEPDELQYLAIEVNAIYSPYDSPYGLLAATPYYAMATQRYMHQYKIRPEEIAQVAVVLRNNASKNLYAQFREKITVDEVLSSRMLVPPIHLLEASPLSDGAAAILLAEEDIAKEICDKPIYIRGMGEYHDASHMGTNKREITDMSAVRYAVDEALQQANLSLSDIDVAEIYGPFAGVELMVYEAVGFFEKGKAPKSVRDGKTTPEGKIPINTSGGRLSLGHPPYVTPLLEAIEIVMQLRNEAGERQVKNAEIGLIQSEHGVVNGAMATILALEKIRNDRN